MVLFYHAPRKAAVKKTPQNATIESLDYQGFGIAKVAGKTWFIENALPNESVQFIIKEEKRQYGTGKAITWQDRSPIRREPRCVWYAQCGGCQTQHITIEAQRTAKQQMLKHQLQKIEPTLQIEPMIVAEEWEYRRRARLSLQYSATTKSLLFGFRQSQSHQLVEIDACPILKTELSQLLSPLRKLFQRWQQPKKLGHIELVLADNGITLLLRHLGSLSLTDEQNLRQFAKQYQLMLFVSEQENGIAAWSEQSPYYQLGELRLQFDIRDFIQVNSSVNQRMVQTALDWLELSAADRVLDLFCGMGNFSLPLAKKAGYVVGIEGVAEMVSKAAANAKRNGIDNIAFYQTDLSDSFADKDWAKAEFNKVLLDPPRSGAAFAIKHIIQLQPQSILYVSCNPATLLRDVKSLTEQGYRLTKSAMIDMFPQTGHMESMTLLVKAT